MVRRNRRRKQTASSILQARQRKRRRVEHVLHVSGEHGRQEERGENILIRNCSNCQRTELHEHDESLSLTRISEYDIQQNKKGKFSMLAGECWDDCHLCLECWKYFCGEKLVYGTAGGVVWPSFVWKTLTSITRDQRLSFWSFMPEGWRLWWLPKER